MQIRLNDQNGSVVVISYWMPGQVDEWMNTESIHIPSIKWSFIYVSERTRWSRGYCLGQGEGLANPCRTTASTAYLLHTDATELIEKNGLHFWWHHHWSTDGQVLDQLHNTSTWHSETLSRLIFVRSSTEYWRKSRTPNSSENGGCRMVQEKFSFQMAQQLLMGHGLLIFEATRSDSDRHTTLGRTPLDEWSAWRRDLYLTTHNPHKRQTSMPPEGFEHIIPASERPQIHALRQRGRWDLLTRNSDSK
jgi:hypothetical protein